MKKKHSIGVDVSKMTLDIVFKNNQKHIKISNDLKGFKSFTKEIKSLGLPLEDCLVVMEHTGVYSYPFENFLSKMGISFSKVPALQIKRSAGIVRGKNDKADAKQIADFGDLHQASLKLCVCSEKTNYLKSLLSLRERFVTQKAGYIASLKEQEAFLGINKSSPLLKTQKRMIAQLTDQIEEIETEIKKVISEDEAMKKNYELLVSITGVGFVVACSMIVFTNNFTMFSDARKFASYCGIAPFDHSSGTSLVRRPRISHLANKKIKCLLDLAARCAINYDLELKAFFKRRTESGKNKRSTINIVRNKLVYRMFAIVKRETPFQKNYQNAA
ncbi:MAG: IS110 family transposase [Bacteroidetes bacterium]|jgi:transposase|nr:IS110 family transposase [Bacteroidota bacterium]MBL0034133.1 IS110 family transposase [Bacteroidota bacterium]HQV99024.1 IS110 family transposase [Bacteroidia bacterium]